MSQPLIAARNAPVRTLKARPEAAARPELQVVTPPVVRRLRLPLPVACVLLLTLGLFALLMTNIAIAGDAYEITDLKSTSQRLADHQQATDEALAQHSSPENLATRAQQLGMVAAVDPTHLSATGDLLPADAPETPTTTNPQPQVEVQAGASR
ncbi:MAG: hypothetical protein ACRYF3_00385 [Janthinobacterium lividum]